MLTGTLNAMTSGCLTWWNPEPAKAQELYESLERIGHGLEVYAPAGETPQSALSRSLIDWGNSLIQTRGKSSTEKHSFKVIPRLSKEQDGFELVDVARKRGPNGYYCEACLRLDGNGKPELVEGYVDMWTVGESFDKYLQIATGAKVGRSLVELTKKLNGTCVKLNGGNYYLPESYTSLWYDVVAAYESVSATEVACMQVVMDQRAARAIRKGIVAELIKAAAEIADELAKGELQESAVERRKARSMELRAKALEYEEILSDTLIEVHAVLDAADQAAAAALATQEAVAVFDGFGA